MSKRLTTEEYQGKLDDLHNGEFELIGEYVRNSDKVSLLHKKCGNVIQKRASKMIMKNPEYCYICSGKNKWKTTDSFKEEVTIKFGDKYTVLGEYKNARTPLLIRNNECGHEYVISPDNLLRGRKCPKHGLRQSSYMNIVEEYLDENNINYIKEKIFTDCKYERCLPFDYYLPEFNTCIEVDGEFHYRVSNFENGEEEFQKTKIKDEIKTNYCKTHGIKLIRLPFFNKDIFKEILNEELYVNAEVS